MVERIISGGQTGVDRAALDVALALGIPCGGWCPKGRRAEDGAIPEQYPLHEAASSRYPERTALNVQDADATLILTRGKPDRGTALTRDLARRHGKPWLVVDLEKPVRPAAVAKWVRENDVVTLNVAGPRLSSAPGIDEQAAAFLRKLLRQPARRKADT
ncbi:MAG: molybdenum cofactor carrier [Planctomycetes bacterium]|nr:molybdenum cofactor carrier [Planctomycetota bacterium]